MTINLENMTAIQNENQGGVLSHLYSAGKQLIKTGELIMLTVFFDFKFERVICMKYWYEMLLCPVSIGF